MSILKKILNALISIIVLIYIFLEDISLRLIVKPVERWLNQFNIAKIIAERIQHLNKYLILIIFLLPFVGMEAMGIVAIKLLSKKKLISGITIYVLKFYLAVPTIFIFRLTKKTLLKFWFIKQSYWILLQIQRHKLYKKVRLYKKILLLKAKDLLRDVLK